MASLEDVKARLYSFNISIAMLVVDTVELDLQRQTGGFFLIKGKLSGPNEGVETTVVVVTGVAGVEAIGTSTVSSEAGALISSSYW